MSAIEIDPDDPARVRVEVEIAANAPIREDSVATLELQGIAGVMLIHISGGALDSPMLAAKPGERYPVIASMPSRFHQFFAGAPELIAQLVLLTREAVELLNEENRRSVRSTLTSLERVTGTVAGKSESLDRIILNAEATTAELRATAVALTALTQTLESRVNTVGESADATLSVARGALAGIDEVMVRQVSPTLGDARQTAQTFKAAGLEVTALLAENRQPITDFTGTGLYEFAGLLDDLRVLLGTLTRLTERLESDPQQFFFGSSKQGFEAR